MITIPLPYGRSYLNTQIPEERLAGVLASRAHQYKPAAGEAELVRGALANRLCVYLYESRK